MRVVIVTRNERGIASRFLRRDPPPGVEIVAALRDEGAPTSRGAHYRLKARKLQRLGPTIVPVALWLREAYARADSDGVPVLAELPVRIERVESANSITARRLLADLEPDLLVALGSRFLHENTFSIPRLGAVNVHHGSVPLYRGGPPIFWELVRDEKEIGYVIHQVDRGIDTGPIYTRGSIAIIRRPSIAETIRATLPPLYEKSLDALGEVLAAICSGSATSSPQPPATGPPNTSPRLGDYLRARAALKAAR